MFGLTMIKDYLIEILDKKKCFDARSYNTFHRGKIALIDSRSLKILGFVDLVDVKQITKDEYVKWHKTGKFENCQFDAPEDCLYFAYVFENPQKINIPIKLSGPKKTWMKIDDSLLKIKY